MDSKDYIKHFSCHLFWDMNPKELDMDICPRQIIQRVLEYGSWEDWKLICAYYGLDRIVSETKQMRSLDVKVLAYLCCISDTKKEDYRCYHFQQLNPVQKKIKI